MAGTTANLAIPYATGTDPVQSWGVSQSKAQADRLDALLYGGSGWGTLVLASGWVSQATWPTPMYRIVSGMIQLRGVVRRSDNAIPGSSNIFNCPAPAGGGTALTSVMLAAVAASTTDPSTTSNLRTIISPRSDGIARCFNPAGIAGTSNLVYLDGLAYSV